MTLDLPRDLLDEVLPPDSRRHGTILRGTTGLLLTEHLHTLSKWLPALRPEEAPLVGSATRDLLAACIAPTPDHIARGLWDPALSPRSIVGAFGISRSKLYRMSEPLGGVAAYIANRRLMAARRVLTDPTDGRRISIFCTSLGFNGAAQFSRSFRRRFGASPSEVRNAAGVKPLLLPNTEMEIARSDHTWLGHGGWAAA